MIRVVKVGTKWCQPCKILQKTLDKIPELDIMEHVDAEENTDFCAEHNVMSVPTLLFFKNGALQKKLVGVVTEKQIKETLVSLNDVG